MKSLTLVDEMVAQIRLHNPAASPEEISEAIAGILGEEIFPNALKNLTLPQFPSYRVVLAETKKIKERRGAKASDPTGINYRRKIIQQIEYVRTEMGWDGIDDVTPKIRVTNSPTLNYPLKTDLPQPKEKMKKEIDSKKETEESHKETIHSTNQPMPIKPEKDVITLSETAQRKIVSEPIFEEVFKNVETKLRGLIESRNLKTEIDVVCKSDFEIPSWNKCVLKVHPPSNLAFTKRMNISTTFDITIRNTIKDLKTSSPEATEYLDNLNRNLFVHIDM